MKFCQSVESGGNGVYAQLTMLNEMNGHAPELPLFVVIISLTMEASDDLVIKLLYRLGRYRVS